MKYLVTVSEYWVWI